MNPVVVLGSTSRGLAARKERAPGGGETVAGRAASVHGRAAGDPSDDDPARGPGAGSR